MLLEKIKDLCKERGESVSKLERESGFGKGTIGCCFQKNNTHSVQ